MTTYLKNSILILLLLLTASAIRATTIAWDGDAGDGLWTTSTNWEGDTLPGTTDDVLIENGDAVTLASGTVTVQSIYLNGNSDLNVSAGATLNVIGTATRVVNVRDCFNCDITNFGTINVQGGSRSITSSSNITNNNGAVITCTGMTSRGIHTESNGSLDNYGTITITGAPAFYGLYVNDDFNNYSTGNLTISDVTGSGIRCLNLLYNQGSITITSNGDGIDGADDFDNYGTLNIDVPTSSNALSSIYDFSNIGTVQGTGIFDIALTNPLGGTFVPGNNIGTMTFNSNEALSGTLEVEINGTTPNTEHDQIVVSGTATVSGTLNASINYTPSNNDRIVIISATTVSDTFSSINPALPPHWNIDYSLAGEVALVYSFTPGKWDGDTGDSAWTTAANWEGDVLPTATDDVVIDNGDAVTLSSGTVTVQSIFLNGNSDLNVGVGATLNVIGTAIRVVNVRDCFTCDITNSGTINVQGGSHSITSSSNITNNNGAVITCTGMTSIGIHTKNNGRLDNYGIITITGAPSLYGLLVDDDFNNYSTGNLTISDVTNAGISCLSVIDNQGSITITSSGDGIYGANDFDNSGYVTLDVADSLDAFSSIYEFSNSGTVQGTGIFDIDLLNPLGGTFIPGNNIGTMTFNSDEALDGTLEVEINGTMPNTEHDQIIVNGTATISGTLNATINYTPTGPDRIIIISATAISGTFSSVSPALPTHWVVDYSVTGEVALEYQYNDGLWDGDAGDGLWTTPANWDGDIIPSSSADVNIDNGDVVTFPSGTDTVNTISICGGSQLMINPGSTINVDNAGTGNTIYLNSNGFSLTNFGTMNITGGSYGIYSDDGTLDNKAGGVVDISSATSYGYYFDGSSSNLFRNSGSFSVTHSGTGIYSKGTVTNSSGGIMVLNNLTGIGIYQSNSSYEISNSGQINISDVGGRGIRANNLYNSGIIDIDSTGGDGIYSFLVTDNSGTITITDAGDDGMHIDDSQLTNSGTISVHNSTNYEINAEYGTTSVLNNTGTIKGAGDFTFQNQDMGGTVEVGNAIGTATFATDQLFTGGSILKFEVNGITPNTEHDQMVVNGTATISGTLNATINYTPTKGDRIVLLSATTISGTFSTLNPALPNDWEIDYSIPGEVALVYDYTVGRWDGEAGDGLWTSADNWEGAIFPTSPDDVIIDNGDEVTLVSGTATVNTISISGGSKLTISSGTTLNVENAGTGNAIYLNSNGFSITNFGTINIVGGSHGVYSDDGTLDNKAGGVIDISSTTSYGYYFNGSSSNLLRNSGTFSVNNSGTGIYTKGTVTNSSGGIMVLNNLTGIGIYQSNSSYEISNSGQINISDVGGRGIRANNLYNSGLIDIDSTGGDGIYSFLVTDNSGTITITDAGDDGMHIDDSQLINSGTISVNNSTNFEINAEYGTTSVLNNTGTIKGAGDFTFQNQDMGGTVEVGNAIGTATFATDQLFTGASILKFEVNGITPNTAHDQIVVNGTATISGILDANINYSPANGDRIVLISATAISGTFSVINPALPEDWSIDYTITGEVALVYSFVPGLWEGDVGDNEWTTAGNWDGNILPSSVDSVIITNGDQVNISSGYITVQTITLEGGSDLTVNTGASLEVSGFSDVGIDAQNCFGCSIDNTGNLSITGGKYSVLNPGGSLTNHAGGNIICTDNTITGLSALITDNYGTIQVTGPMTSDAMYTYSGFTNYVGGQITIDNTSDTANTIGINTQSSITNNGTINISGSLETGINTNYYTNTGTTHIIETTSNAIVVSSGLINNGGTLSGTGAYDTNETDLDGTVSPGDSTGHMIFEGNQTFTASNSMVIDVNGTMANEEHDLITVFGNAMIGGTLHVSINYTPTAEDRIPFLYADSIMGTFSNIDPPLPSNWSIDYSVPGEVALKVDFIRGIWDGDAGDGQWLTAANWSGDVLPTSTDDIIIGNGDTVTISSGSIQVREVLLENGSQLILSQGVQLFLIGQ